MTELFDQKKRFCGCLKAHDLTYAISPSSNLDKRTREVYRENIEMTKALALHLESEESLRRAKERLEISNRQLTAEKELNQRLVKDKIAQARHQKKTIKDLQVRWKGRPVCLPCVNRRLYSSLDNLYLG